MASVTHLPDAVRNRVPEGHGFWRPYPAAFLIAFVALTVLIPSSQVVEPLGGAGSPATLLGVLLLGLWLLLKISGSDLVSPGFGGLHIAFTAYIAAMLASYYAAMADSIPPVESRGADRGLLTLASVAGVFLLTSDGLRTRRQIELVLKTMSAALVVEAVIAITQYLLQRNWYIDLPFPGLTPAWSAGEDGRSGLLRTSGTAVHAIEYGVVQMVGLATLLHWTFFAPTRRARVLWATGLSLVLATLPLSLARSPMIGLFVVLIMLVPTWPTVWRLRALVIAPFAIVAMRAAFPGTLGTVLSLFTFISEDPSTTGRTSDYESVTTLLQGNLWWGRGIGTLIPDVYLTLDNQYLSAVLDSGIAGLLTTIALFVTGIATGFRTRARFADRESRDLVHALTTGITVAAVCWALFDGFAFQQVTGLLLLCPGSLAAMRRLGGNTRATAIPAPELRGVRRWAAAVVGGFVVLSVLAWGLVRGQGPGEYSATAFLLIRTADPANGLFVGQTDTVSALMTEWMRTPEARDKVRQTGGTAPYQIAQGDGSLAPATDNQGRGPVVRIRAVSQDAAEALDTSEKAARVLQGHLTTSQRSSGAPDDQRVIAPQIVSPSGPTWQGGSAMRARASLALLAGVLGALAFMVVRMITRRRGGEEA